jgi:hydrogenase maturation protein HypF
MMPVAERTLVRVRMALGGTVQGVGFRPFVYRLATELELTGWVCNSSAGILVEVEGDPARVGRFQERLEAEMPPAAVVLTRETAMLAPAGSCAFEIRSSHEEAAMVTGVLPDLATCPACLAELSDPANRRFGYPFTNCTHCGPRYTIVDDIPYDRQRTTMRSFVMCPECRREYTDPADRRFHAQPNACPRCGPRVWIEGRPAEGSPDWQAAQAIRAGAIVAIKGIGGFQLVVDARQALAVARLRQRKHREEKPFALMMPGLEMVRQYCHVAAAEERLLKSRAAPIVLLRPNGNRGIAPNVAGSSPYMGVMLPYSPLHHLLMRECGFPVVATSGNLSDEPIATANGEARARLGEIADLFLTHDRPISRPCDDSVARVVRNRESVIRRARGFAPLPVYLGRKLPAVLAVGGHLKNTVAIAVGRQVFLSQHVGDLDTPEARQAFARTIDDLCRLYRFQPAVVACDLHPDYASTRWAQSCGLPVAGIQHHQAHAAACAAENGIEGPYLGVAWDGTGYGTDGTVWGGEFFLVEGTRFERIAHLRPFRLPGGEAAVRECWRSAASVQCSALGPDAVGDRPQWPVLLRMLERGINAPWTTSVGRLFDAVAAIAGVAQESHFEGQAAMLLERQIGGLVTGDSYPLPDGDWGPLVAAVHEDVASGEAAARISARFHNALANWILSTARRAGAPRVVLSGGVFQNGYLVERTAALLEANRFQVYTHHGVPPNDGGIALGQAVLAALRG